MSSESVSTSSSDEAAVGGAATDISSEAHRLLTGNWMEAAEKLVVSNEWAELDEILAAQPDVTPALLLGRALAAFYRDQKPETVKLCREILQKDTPPLSRHLESLARYYLLCALETEDEIEQELKIWQDKPDSDEDLAAVLSKTTAGDLKKLKEEIDSMSKDDETRWLFPKEVPKQLTGVAEDNVMSCSYCSLSFSDKNELRAHCQTDEHQKVLMSDEGK